MQDIRNLIDVIENNVKPQVGDAFDPEFGDNKAVILTVVEQVVDDAVIITADDKALKFIPDLEEACGCEMPQEESGRERS